MTVRRTLPNRRSLELVDFEFRGSPYILGIGRFEDGSLAEVFIDGVGETGKGMTPLNDDAKDAAVTLSIALQYGTPAEAIRAAVSRTPDGSAVGIVGCVLDIAMGLKGSENGD